MPKGNSGITVNVPLTTTAVIGLKLESESDAFANTKADGPPVAIERNWMVMSTPLPLTPDAVAVRVQMICIRPWVAL